MFRLIRTIILVILAFVAGILWGDEQRRGACQTEGGDWRDKTCFLKDAS